MTCPDCGNMIAYNSYFSAFYCPRCGGFFKKVKPMTNADRIRSMSDKELAEFIDDIATYVATGKYCTGFLHVSGFPYTCFDTKKCCEKHVVEWLKKPAEDDE